jgi:trehalose 6-phosphate synthase/phosphatase
MTRLLIVSNRLPVTLTVHGEDPSLVASSGGLATAMRCVHDEGSSLWIGYIGDTSKLSEGGHKKLQAQLAERRLVAVPVSTSEVALYYDGFSNGVLWPLFHYLLEKVRLEVTNEWRAYKAVNQRFADAIVANMKSGDAVWIHDYQLALVPGMVRKKIEDARIGFFLHVPWPASDVFRILPHREEILRSLLASDVVGFHTEGYRHNFIHSAAKVLGTGLGIDSLEWEDRHVRVGVYPIGIDVARFGREDPRIDAAIEKIKQGTAGKKTLLGLDRLDYTKGVPRRLLALDRLFEREPQLRERVHFIQIAVPTREKVDAYAELRRQVNEIVGRINSQHGSATGSPIQFLYRSVDEDDLLALYRAADAMVVTPLRDGMNLVAKEYIAARTHEDGALVLSEFAGAAAELDAALLVNPYDIGSVAMAMRRALMMPMEEQKLRMRRLRQRVMDSPVDAWAKSFVADLVTAKTILRGANEPSSMLDALMSEYAQASDRALLLDYDGTLVPIAPLPDLATPDPALLTLLTRLGTLPNTELHVVSGRSREVLTQWLGALPIWLHAEHGFWSRTPDGTWTQRQPEPAFRQLALDIMHRYARTTPGALVEPKAAAVAFHYRGADPHLASVRVPELRKELAHALGAAAELLDGHKVLEVKPTGISKARIVEAVLAARGRVPSVLAAGDDRTDEDMFSALTENALTIRVGPGATRAKFRVSTPFELRRLLARMLTSRVATSSTDQDVRI